MKQMSISDFFFEIVECESYNYIFIYKNMMEDI